MWPPQAGGAPSAQQCSFESAVAKRRSAMLRLGQVDAAEIAFAEHDPLGVQPAEVLVPEISTGEFAVGPMLQRYAVRLCSAYSLTAISASVADLRLRASILITGICGGRVSALRTSPTGYLGAPSNSLTATCHSWSRSMSSTATRNGRL